MEKAFNRSTEAGRRKRRWRLAVYDGRTGRIMVQSSDGEEIENPAG